MGDAVGSLAFLWEKQVVIAVTNSRRIALQVNEVDGLYLAHPDVYLPQAYIYLSSFSHFLSFFLYYFLASCVTLHVAAAKW